MRLLAKRLIAVVTLLGMNACEEECSGVAVSIPVEIGVDVDLHAVEQVDGYEYVAVGESGTVVYWGIEPSGDVFAHHHDLGDAALHGLLIDDSSWWAVGDGGLVAVTDNRGADWTTITLAGGNDLHAIAQIEGAIVIVGDEALTVRMPDGTWLEPEPPAQGWGSLRGVGFDTERVYAVGLGGVIWSATNPNEWTAEASGVDTDLFDVGPNTRIHPATTVAVGAGGTILQRDSGGWSKLDTGVSADLLDYANGLVVAEGGPIYWVEEPLRVFQEALDALAMNDGWPIATVGERGAATRPGSSCL